MSSFDNIPLNRKKKKKSKSSIPGKYLDKNYFYTGQKFLDSDQIFKKKSNPLERIGDVKSPIRVCNFKKQQDQGIMAIPIMKNFNIITKKKKKKFNSLIDLNISAPSPIHLVKDQANNSIQYGQNLVQENLKYSANSNSFPRQKRISKAANSSLTLNPQMRLTNSDRICSIEVINKSVADCKKKLDKYQKAKKFRQNQKSQSVGTHYNSGRNSDSTQRSNIKPKCHLFKATKGINAFPRGSSCNSPRIEQPFLYNFFNGKVPTLREKLNSTVLHSDLQRQSIFEQQFQLENTEYSDLFSNEKISNFYNKKLLEDIYRGDDDILSNELEGGYDYGKTKKIRKKVKKLKHTLSATLGRKPEPTCMQIKSLAPKIHQNIIQKRKSLLKSRCKNNESMVNININSCLFKPLKKDAFTDSIRFRKKKKKIKNLKSWIRKERLKGNIKSLEKVRILNLTCAQGFQRKNMMMNKNPEPFYTHESIF
ncbi:unnamed protein product [Moneuplotes crassus]|uniref:Uncharacterized protein n=1 Tax=Euplotes crassus TaxID=5936 RepID=A0AAD1U132_EUPCR|nr:unnamed protein product [Moneuplotes crassus]